MSFEYGPSPFTSPLSEFVYARTYSRWQDTLGRRETWPETVTRATDFLFERAGSALDDEVRNTIRHMIHDHKAMPSMRLLWSAGPAAKHDETTLFNCSYATVSDLRIFDEALYILMCGTGFGFSVESEFVEQLPRILKSKKLPPLKYVIDDSRRGWAEAVRFGLETWFSGGDVEFDYSGLRPAGARLLTMGGRSSGPDPLRRLLDFMRSRIKARAGRRLRTIDAHDILCMIGEVVVAGGVRRSSLISLSDLDDKDMRLAKFGNFWDHSGYRRMANNSVAYTEKPSSTEFMEEFLSLAQSGSGERGLFNREAILSTSPRRKKFSDGGTNPCAEINLRDKEFCNLTSIIARSDDTLENLIEKAQVAAILGTIQSTFTHFPYLRQEWADNCNEERLLGVSLSGQMDSQVARDPEVQAKLRQVIIDTNREYAAKLGINQSVAVTAVKPEGTSSQLVNSSSGMHDRWSKYQIRHVRVSATDPILAMLKDAGAPCYPEAGQDPATASEWVIAFPIKAPDGSSTRNDRTAIEQLNYWKQVKTQYTEHNPSISVYVGEDEWIEVGAWLYRNWDIIGGLSLFPKNDSVYADLMPPNVEITEEKYLELVSKFPEIDYTLLSQYESDDNTTGSRDYACTSGACEI